MGALGDGRSKSGLDAGLLLLKEGSSLEQEPQLVRKEHQEADQDHEQHIAHVPSNGRAALGLAVGGRQEAKKGLVRRHKLIHYLGMAQLRFSEAHVWVRVEGAEAVLGLSDYLRAKRKMGHLESDCL